MSFSPNYATEFCSWWDSINPDWQLRIHSQLTIGGGGDWGTMAIPGINGFVNIIGSLLGLREVVKASEWLAMLRDIGWVVVEVRGAVGDG